MEHKTPLGTHSIMMLILGPQALYKLVLAKSTTHTIQAFNWQKATGTTALTKQNELWPGYS